MAFMATAITSITIIIFFLGQLAKIKLFSVSFPLIDVCLIILSTFNIYKNISENKLSIKNKFFLYFLITLYISFIYNLIFNYNFSLKSFFYLIRLSVLLSFFIFPINKSIKNQKNKSFLKLALVANIVFGLIQYFVWPDSIYFKSLNWDPHLNRLISTFLDPTFTGLIYLFLFFSIFTNPPKNNLLKKILLTFSYIAMSLTYSRSTLLCFISVFTYISIKTKNIKILVTKLLLVLLTIIILPNTAGEGTRLNRTSTIFAKIENYKEGIRIFSQKPILGHGYNNLYQARTINNPDSHANYGFDSSLITILSTTGIIGLFFFLLAIKKEFKSKNQLKKILLLSTLIHSFFANSLLYPWVLFPIFLLY
ncbi:O-antigen ligase family protein [Patescibacteria group bacterium]|nr:O-antigen ligase family protein [Patescibacteria group bacterium]